MPASNPILILADNGSTKASATLQLRLIAKQLSNRANKTVFPVSLQHADVIAADELGGEKALVLRSFLEEQLKKGKRAFIILPLFFGNSRALTTFIPNVQAELQAEQGDFEITILDTLYPPLQSASERNSKEDSHANLPHIIYDHIVQTAEKNTLPLQNIVLVDHGSPSPQITAVRNGVAKEVQEKLGQDVLLEQGVMERRKGKQYDFNGVLLKDWLVQKAQAAALGKKDSAKSAIVALLFSLPGRHAGEGGDIVTICDDVMRQSPDFTIAVSPLVGEHPMLLEILADRLNV